MAVPSLPPLRNPFDAGCNTELVDMTPIGIIFGSVLCIASGIAFIPSLTKPIKMKSTAGVSPSTLILTNLQQTLALANTLVLKWPQVQQCGAHPLGCQPSLIQLYTVAVSAIMLFPQHLLTVYYPNPPEALNRNRIWWYGQLLVCGGIIVASIWWSTASKCQEDDALRQYGIWCGLLSSVLMIFRFVPQVYITMATRSSGSISLITYGCIGVGGFVFTYFSVAVSHEEVTTWLPVFVGNCFQTLILIMCILYDYVLPKKTLTSTAGGSEVGSGSFMFVRTATASSFEKVRSWSAAQSSPARSASRTSRYSRPDRMGSRMSRLGSGPLLPRSQTEAGEVFDASGGYIVPPAAVLEDIGDVVRNWVSRSSSVVNRSQSRRTLRRGVSDASSPGFRSWRSRQTSGPMSRLSWQTETESEDGDRNSCRKALSNLPSVDAADADPTQKDDSQTNAPFYNGSAPGV